MILKERTEYQYPNVEYFFKESADKLEDLSPLYNWEFEGINGDNFEEATCIKRETSFYKTIRHLSENREECIKILEDFYSSDLTEEDINLLKNAKTIEYISGKINKWYNRTYYIVLDGAAYSYAADGYTATSPRSIHSCEFEKQEETPYELEWGKDEEDYWEDYDEE
jgi:hypothetical protein